ncbi:MAG: nitrous oxide reductase accessory protein NosL [Campylobacterales bacterium]|nr:nitrous oxide reductase accessory protein NosL [Campylobacterales bacterium]
MVKRWIMVCLGLFLGTMMYAQEFSKVASHEPELIQKGDDKLYCPICGMNLKQYYKTSHGAILSDGTAKQYCSIRCLAADWEAIESRLVKVVVTDVVSEKLIDAKEAFYVIGSKVPGTMSQVSKLAFAKEADALAFIKEHGGELGRFENAFAKAKASLNDDVDEFIKKKQKGMYPMGEKIYHKACDKEKIHLHDFNTISELKFSLKKTKLCGELEEKELQAVSLYLWEILRFAEHNHTHKSVIHVEKGEKCPVCGMFVYKYPKWAARMSYEENGKKMSHAFDGVKDLLKFYHNPSKWGNYTKLNDEAYTILVSDYYTQEAIDGKKAFYVIGSDTYGPMGKEFIPFATLKSAQSFLKDHKGSEILSFDKISEALVYAQDK